MTTANFDLSGKTALVTGAGRGIGRALALGLAQAGARVIAVSRTAAEVSDVAAAIESAGGKAAWDVVDITRVVDLEAMVERSLQRFDGIDILVNNAGVTRKIPALEVSEADWDFIMDTNLKGFFFTAQLVGRHMVRRGGGSIVNMASVASSVGISGSSLYCASKGGAAQFTRALAVEWAAHGVRVNAVAPAYIDTPLLAWIKEQPEAYDRIIKRTPMARMGCPEEIVGAVIFLASEASSYVTGEVIGVDGGFMAFGI